MRSFRSAEGVSVPSPVSGLLQSPTECVRWASNGVHSVRVPEHLIFGCALLISYCMRCSILNLRVLGMLEAGGNLEQPRNAGLGARVSRSLAQATASQGQL